MKYLSAMAALACAVMLAATTRAHAHGFEGDRFFPPTVSSDDPFATDEYSVTFQEFNNPSGSDGTPMTHEIDVSSEFDKEIFPKFALGVAGTYINLDPSNHQGPAQDGFDNVELSAKYQLWESAVHEWILSVGGEIDLGDTGSKALGVDSFTTYTPTVYFGKGFGDLPDSLAPLKPFALTGTVGVAIPGQSQNQDGSTNSDSLQLGFALEYSLPYLEQHVKDIGLPRPFKDMIPLVEFTSSSPFDRAGGPTTGTVCPGILWEQPDFQLGAEALIPINGHTGPNVGFVFQVQFFIDDLFPRVFGHPVFGHDEDSDVRSGLNH
jgi:hypothetical protein